MTSHTADPSTAQPGEAAEAGTLGSLLSEVSKDLTTLIRQEVELAKAELTQTATRAGRGAGMFTGAAIAGHMVLLFVSIAAWWAIGDGLNNWAWSAVIVSAVWGLIAAVMAARGKTELAKIRGLNQTTDTIKKIPDALTPTEEAHR